MHQINNCAQPNSSSERSGPPSNTKSHLQALSRRARVTTGEPSPSYNFEEASKAVVVN